MMGRKTPEQDAITRVVRWAIMIFFAYILFTGGFHTPPSNHPQGPAASGAQAANNAEKDCDNHDSGFTNFSFLAKALIPTALPVIRTEELAPGSGEGAVCGQHATLHYEFALQSGSVIFSNYKGDPTTVTLGDGGILRGPEMGIMGMKPGGERKVTFPSALGLARVKDLHMVRNLDQFTLKPDDFKDAILVGKMSLVSLSPAEPATTQPLRIVERKFTGGARAACGDTVRLRLTVWKTDGTKVFSSDDDGRPVVLTLGGSEAPYGIEQSVLGMGENGERTAIIPAAYTKPLVDELSRPLTPRLLGITWPNETLLAEITLEHIGDEMPSFAAPAAAAPAALAKPAPIANGEKDSDKDDDENEAPGNSGSGGSKTNP